MRKLVAGAATLLLVNSCSWIFMEHVSSDYDGRSEPRCTATRGWALLDGVGLLVDLLAIGFEASQQNPSGGQIALNAADGGFALASMLTGLHWASTCDDARELFDSDAAAPGEYVPPEDSPEAKELRRERAEQLRRQRALPDAGVDASGDAPPD